MRQFLFSFLQPLYAPRLFAKLLVMALFVSALLVSLPSSLQAQAGDSSNQRERPDRVAKDKSASTESTKVSSEVQRRISSLESIAKAIKREKEDLKQIRRLLAGKDAEGRQEEYQQEIQAHLASIEQLEQNFRQIAAGVDLSDLRASDEDQVFDLSTEITSLLKPLLNELQALTEAPRQIDSIRSRIQNLSQQLRTLKHAKEEVIQLLESTTPDTATKSLLESTLKEWELRYDEIKTEIEIQDQKLSQRLQNKVPISKSLENVFEVFFKSRGRNFLIAFGITLLFYFGIKKLYETVQRLPALNKKQHSHTSRIITLIYILVSTIGSAAVFVSALYFTGDWLLLTVALLLLIGLAWGSKAALPKFWEQIALLLNIGPVREGERVIYNGVPWKVEKIHLYCKLINPSLTGGNIRLPIADLSSLRSRPFFTEEGYFPTKEGDWILIDGTTLARVVVQTPDVVHLVSLGGARQTYATSDFLGLHARVLSKGFRILTSFGIDYAHQKHSTQDIPETMLSYVSERLEALFPDLEKVTLKVEFEEAGASSLNLAILADFPGEHAKDYSVLKRLIQRCAVDACNEHNWNIPFEQLTLHVADKPLLLKNA